TYTSGDCRVEAVTRAETATNIPSLAERHTTQMGARTEHDDPVLFALTCRARQVGRLCVRIDIVVASDWILKIGERHLTGFFDLLLRTVTDEDRLATPLGSHRHAGLNRRDINVDGCQSQRRCIRAHLVDKRPGGTADSHYASHAGSDVKKIAAVMIGRFVRAHGHWVLSPYFCPKEPCRRHPDAHIACHLQPPEIRRQDVPGGFPLARIEGSFARYGQESTISNLRWQIIAANLPLTGRVQAQQALRRNAVFADHIMMAP